MKARIIATFIALTMLVFTLSGCKNEVDEFIGLFDEMAGVADGAKGDCEKQAEALGKYLEDNKSRIEEVGKKIKEKDSKMTAGQDEAFKAAHEKFEKATDGCPEAAISMLGLIGVLGE